MRSSLVRGEASPSDFRAALADVPADERDAWLDLVFDIDDLPEDDPALPRGCVPYLPCSVATVLDALREADVTGDDVFVDVGAGLGRVALLTHLVCGAGCIGLEIQPRLVKAAREHAARLNAERVRYVEGDAADLVGRAAIGTVFFLYCPFGGARLERVLDQLHDIARARQLRVCCVGMPTLDRPWLAAVSTIADLVVYRSHAHRVRRENEVPTR